METTSEAKDLLKQAYAYEEAGDFEAALEACEAAIERDPLLAEAHNLWGILLEALGDPSAALAAYEKAVELDPEFAEAANNLIELRAELAEEIDLVTIATFSHPTEAHIPRARLESEGIWAFLADEHTIGANWLYKACGHTWKERPQDRAISG